jgi:hypothetical protein
MGKREQELRALAKLSSGFWLKPSFLLIIPLTKVNGYEFSDISEMNLSSVLA